MTDTPCTECGPPETCAKCRTPFPHTPQECDERNDLVQLHTIEAFGVTIPVRIELRELGRSSIRHLDGEQTWDVHVSINGAGSFFETTNPGSERAITETRAYNAERDAYNAEQAKKDSSRQG